jgi:hypothetical protein
VQNFNELLVVKRPMPSNPVAQFLDCIQIVLCDPRKEELVIRVVRRRNKMEVLNSPIVQEMIVEERAVELALKGHQVVTTLDGGDEVTQFALRVGEFSRTMDTAWSAWDSMPLNIQ